MFSILPQRKILNLFEIFTGKGTCSACHLIGEEYALFTDNSLHNTGLGYDIAMSKEPPTYRVQLAPGTFVDVNSELINNVIGKSYASVGMPTPTPTHVGRYHHSGLTKKSRFSLAHLRISYYNSLSFPSRLIPPTRRGRTIYAYILPKRSILIT